MSDVPEGYIPCLGRDVPHPPLAHLHEGDFGNVGNPMCRYGWNRDDGQSFSIWRNNVGDEGICKICMRRAKAGLKGVPPRRVKCPECRASIEAESTRDSVHICSLCGKWT